MQEVAKQLVYGRAGVSWGVHVEMGVWAEDRGCRQVSTASLVTWQGCMTWAVARWLIYGGSGAGWGVGTGCGGVLQGLAACFVVLLLWPTVQSVQEQENGPSSMMMWQ